MLPAERTSARLIFRPLRDGDVDALHEIQGDRDHMRHTFWAESREASRVWLERHEASRDANGFAPWVASRRSDGRVVGWGSPQRAPSGAMKALGIDPLVAGWGVEVTYFFHPAVAGMGFATELVHAAVACGFTEHRLTRISAFARPENAASIRVLTKCGFTLRCYEPELERNHYEVRR
jgi:RimJ/RimL family protein N-acetyltransferase